MKTKPGLLLYLHPLISHKLPYSYPTTYPFDQMVNRVFPEQQLDPYHYTLVVDRYHDIKALPQNTKTVEQMCLERAQQLNMIDDDLYVMYSGGIDSTAVVVSMIETYSKEELSRVHLLMSHNSIAEFPDLWPILLKKFNGRIHSSYQPLVPILNKGQIVTGELGDQIFGSDIILAVANAVGEQYIFEPWQKSIPPTLAGLFNWDLRQTAAFIKRYDHTLAECPFPIRTAFDWCWWFNYTNKVQHVIHRLFIFDNLGKLFDRVHHFYYTKDWQRWSLDNHDMKIMKSLVTYKWPLKKFIISHTGLDSYAPKRKIGSLGNIWNVRDFNFGLNTNYELLSYEQTKQYVRSD